MCEYAHQSSACCPGGGCDVRTDPADLYTQTSAQTVNNGTHTHTHTHSPESNLLTNTHYYAYTWQLLSPHAISSGLTRAHIQHVYIARGFVPTCSFTTVSEATSPAAPEGHPLLFSLCTLHTESAYKNVKAQTDTLYR